MPWKIWFYALLGSCRRQRWQRLLPWYHKINVAAPLQLLAAQSCRHIVNFNRCVVLYCVVFCCYRATKLTFTLYYRKDGQRKQCSYRKLSGCAAACKSHCILHSLGCIVLAPPPLFSRTHPEAIKVAGSSSASHQLNYICDPAGTATLMLPSRPLPGDNNNCRRDALLTDGIDI